MHLAAVNNQPTGLMIFVKLSLVCIFVCDVVDLVFVLIVFLCVCGGFVCSDFLSFFLCFFFSLGDGWGDGY